MYIRECVIKTRSRNAKLWAGLQPSGAFELMVSVESYSTPEKAPAPHRYSDNGNILSV